MKWIFKEPLARSCCFPENFCSTRARQLNHKFPSYYCYYYDSFHFDFFFLIFQKIIINSWRALRSSVGPSAFSSLGHHHHHHHYHRCPCRSLDSSRNNKKRRHFISLEDAILNWLWAHGIAKLINTEIKRHLSSINYGNYRSLLSAHFPFL